MSKAEEFIQQNVKDCTNKSLKKGEYYLWLSPDEARKAVEIEREEVIEKVTDYLNSKLYDWVQISNFCRREYPDTIMKRDFIDDLKQVMKDE